MQGEFSSLYMLVNATLGTKSTDLFELSSSDRTRSVSHTVLVLYACIVLFCHCVFVCICTYVYIYCMYVCANQVKIQVSKEALGGIPIWIIIISILIGLLILALVIFALWKVIFPESDCRVFQIFNYLVTICGGLSPQSRQNMTYAMTYFLKGIVQHFGK